MTTVLGNGDTKKKHESFLVDSTRDPAFSNVTCQESAIRVRRNRNPGQDASKRRRQFVRKRHEEKARFIFHYSVEDRLCSDPTCYES